MNKILASSKVILKFSDNSIRQKGFALSKNKNKGACQDE